MQAKLINQPNVKFTHQHHNHKHVYIYSIIPHHFSIINFA